MEDANGTWTIFALLCILVILPACLLEGTYGLLLQPGLLVGHQGRQRLWELPPLHMSGLASTLSLSHPALERDLDFQTVVSSR